MRLARFFPVTVVCVLVVIAAHAASGTRALAQSDPHDGTWIFNAAKSKYTGAPAPKEQTSVYTVTGQTVRVTTKGTGGDGKPTNTEFTASFDGKDHPVKGSPDWDAIAVKRLDSHTFEFTRKRGGKTVQTATTVVAKDGKTRTITVSGVNAQGQKISYVAVYEKK